MRSAAWFLCAISFSAALTAVACAAPYTAADTPADDAASEGGPFESGAGGPGEADAADAADAAIGCNGAIDCERVVFLSSILYPANQLEGLDHADTICTALAASATAGPRVKNRSFAAWLSVSTENAADRLVHGTAAYVLPDETLISSNWDEFTSGTHSAPITLTESGVRFDAGAPDAETSAKELVWTGTDSAGFGTTSTCDDWRNGDGIGSFGDSTAVSSSWSYQSNTGGPPLHIYCIER